MRQPKEIKQECSLDKDKMFCAYGIKQNVQRKTSKRAVLSRPVPFVFQVTSLTAGCSFKIINIFPNEEECADMILR